MARATASSGSANPSAEDGPSGASLMLLATTC